jgi:hypothetical protein
MKKRITLMIFLAAFFIMPSYSYAENLGAVRLSLIDGDVQIHTEDTGDWVPAVINMPLSEGDRIWVPEEGRAELLLNDGTVLRLRENSALDTLRIEDHSYQFYLDTGHAYVNFRGPRGHLVQLDTPVSSIRAYDRGIFWVDIPDDRSSDISVEEGFVYAETKRGSTTVNEGYTLSIRGDDYADLHPLEPSNGWTRWNEERDRALYEKRYSSRYLPEELSPYSYDFDRYGTWRSVPEYGYVWTPSVYVSAGWAPYRQGRWVWIRGDYVWVSYEPWGWAPYHYGRWIFNVSIGWCWVPPVRGAVYWGPGYVSWVYTPDYVAWVPLAPRETYYGYGYYGPHSVNITRVNVTNIRVKNVYKNVYVNNAVTVINKDTFVRGRKNGPVHVKENPFLREKISVGRPAIEPIKETRRPDLREVKGGNQPPMRIREVKVEERKKERPLVPRKTYSVMRPGAPSAEMPLKSEKGKAPREKAVEPSRERREYRVPAERKIERPEKQKAPVERKRQYPEQRDIKSIPPKKRMPAKPEGNKLPAERKMERPPLKQREYGSPPQKEMKTPPPEQKERGAFPRKESGKPQKQIVPEQKEKVSPEQKKRERKEIEEPGTQGGPVENRGEVPIERGRRF